MTACSSQKLANLERNRFPATRDEPMIVRRRRKRVNVEADIDMGEQSILLGEKGNINSHESNARAKG